MLDFSGKVAVVTGASRGIGRGIAEMLAARGALVVAGARGQNAQGTVDAILAAGGRAEVVALDVTDAASVDAMVAGALNRHGHIDVLVNNAGITRDQLMLRLKREEWDEVIATNLTSAFTCVQAVLKTMIRQRSGRIISISSVVGQMGNAGQANYAASKAGTHRIQHGAGARGCLAQHHGQRHRARHDRHRHDARRCRQGANRLGSAHSAETARDAGRYRGGGLLSRLG
jgi:3-oxoacyl-[acyl-carrier protein] reductase